MTIHPSHKSRRGLGLGYRPWKRNASILFAATRRHAFCSGLAAGLLLACAVQIALSP